MSDAQFIIQAADIETADLKALHALARARAIEKIEGPFLHQAFRLTAVAASAFEAVRARCTALHADVALLQGSAPPIRMIAMDMDSTLITIECIDEIADFVGRKSEVAAITASAMRGEIDWPTSFRARVALLSGLAETTLARVYAERLQLSIGAEQLVRAAQRAGIKVMLVSGGFTFFTERLKARLDLDFAFSNTLEIVDGKLTGKVLGSLCDASAKAAHLANTASLLGFQPSAVLAIGDGANDIPMMQAAGVSVAYHAKPVVRVAATHAISHVGLDGVLALLVS